MEALQGSRFFLLYLRETIGLSYAVELVKDAFCLSAKSSKDKGVPAFLDKLSTADRASLAEDILKGLDLLENFARIVLFCGHGSATKNNPYASGLDCGACGGHAGDANAVSLLLASTKPMSVSNYLSAAFYSLRYRIYWWFSLRKARFLFDYEAADAD